MKIILALMLASGVYTKILKIYPQQFLLNKGTSNNIDEIFSTYLAVSENQKLRYQDYDTISHMKNLLIKKLKEHHKMPRSISETRSIEETAYFIIKSIRQRNKRYTSYLTFCHYKLCNMGRKRTARFYQMINSEEDNNEP